MNPVPTMIDGGTPQEAERALAWLADRQHPDGAWEGEVVWCPMILAQYVIAQRMLGREIDASTRAGMIRHFQVTRRNGAGWGLHSESEPYVFVTALSYVALRLLGEGPESELARPAREWLRAQPGGVLAIPTWGKFWLSMIGLYEYRGMNPVPPELFLLPGIARKLYCHTRYIYLGIAYLYGRRFRVDLPETPALRCELYDAPYGEIDFGAHRHSLAATDVYVRPTRVLRLACDLLNAMERMPLKPLRRRALDECARQIEFEQRASRYQAISPVNGVLNTLALKDRHHPDLEASLQGLASWRWEDPEEGVRFAGARSHAWDTAFAMQACLEYAPGVAQQRDRLRRAYGFLRATQITEEIPGYRENGRDPAMGGWCFSDGRHRWPVSDCTAEALCAILAAHRWPGLIPQEDQIPPGRLAMAARFILSRQNADGGFGTYERRRGGSLLERVNPSEMYGQCMTELSYTECTASAVKALSRYVAEFPEAAEAAGLRRAVGQGCEILRRRQCADGSWQGFWGINFTYATFFATEALDAAKTSPARDAGLERAAAWLIARQRPDGGWGEHFSSCRDGVYRAHSKSQAVMTSWALLALLKITGPKEKAVKRGVEWLKAHQQPDGSWPKEAVNGVFFGSAMLDYRLYRAYFPAWTLARYALLVEGSSE